MKRIKLSEEQDRMIQGKLNEMLTNNTKLSLKYNNPTGKTPKSPAEIGNAVVDASKEASKLPQNGQVSTDVSVTADPDNDNKQQQITIGSDSTNESILITKKQLSEVKLRKLKSNSQVIKVKNFMK